MPIAISIACRRPLAVLHGLRPLGPAGYGDLRLHQGDFRGAADQAVQWRRYAPRFHLCRRRRQGGRQDARPSAASIAKAADAAPDPGASAAPWRVFNIGNNQPEELNKIVALLEKELGRTATKELLPMQPGDVYATFADVDDLAREIDFRPSTSIEDGIARFVSWYRAYHI